MSDPNASPSLTACALCASTDLRPFSVRDCKSGKPLVMAVCQACSLVQQGDIPDAQTLERYYRDAYRQDYKGTWHPKPKHVLRAGRNARDRLRFLSACAPVRPGDRLLDIGAGGGELVYLAGKSGFSAQGLEPNQGYSEFARQQYGVQVSTGALAELPSASVEVVTMFHVLEHLPEPAQALARIHETLTRDGFLFIEVPNILQKDASPHNIYFKAHLFYFNAATLGALAAPWFELIQLDERSNLRAVFRRREEIKPFEPVDPETVRQALGRFKSKSWRQYLFEGGGLAKPLARARQLLEEQSVRGVPARSILDGLEIS